MVLFELNLSEAIVTLKPLTIFVFGMVVYSFFVFKFYRFLAKKDIFKLNLNRYNRVKHPFLEKILSVIFYIIEYIFVMPIFIFFWSGVLAILLIFLTKQTSVQNLLLVSIALVGAIRITAHYNEDLSADLAKMLPFALLAVFLGNISFFSPDQAMLIIRQLPSQLNTFIYYLLFVIIMEILLRITQIIINLFVKHKNIVSAVEVKDVNLNKK